MHAVFSFGLKAGSTNERTEAQIRRVDVKPPNNSPDLGLVWQGRGGSLCIAGIIPMPTLVLPEFPSTSGDLWVRSPVAGPETVYVYIPPIKLIPAVLCRVGPSPAHSPFLAIPDVVLGANSSSVSASVGDSDQKRSAVSASRQDLAPSTRDLKAVGMAHQGPPALISSLSADDQATIVSARAFSTRRLYSSKSHAVDPVNYPIGPVLEFLQEKLAAGAAATTLRVYVAAIAARRELDEVPLGRHRCPGGAYRKLLLNPWSQLQSGLAASKHIISLWSRGAISLAYEVRISAFGRIPPGVWLPLKLFLEESP
ncbi:Plipastatin synthase subunit B [Labeo rohita]|uniref:Plipastatin synthase subunit B n=1 Tax=Labeo rohita TaxID=84645 RepID=A0ABQ8LA23_LABRO|nr:Plipastatin synthase subunit B [Labeo rohita]